MHVYAAQFAGRYELLPADIKIKLQRICYRHNCFINQAAWQMRVAPSIFLHRILA